MKCTVLGVKLYPRRNVVEVLCACGGPRSEHLYQLDRKGDSDGATRPREPRVREEPQSKLL